MNILDIVLSIFLILGFVRGFFKGFLLELSGLVALVVGIYGAIRYSDAMLGFLQTFISWEEQYLSLLSFAVTFIIIVTVISILASVLTKMAHIVMLGIVNRILGAVFGLIKMAFLASVLFLFLNQTEAAFIEEETKDNSVLYQPIARLAPMILPTVIREIKEGELFETSSEDL